MMGEVMGKATGASTCERTASIRRIADEAKRAGDWKRCRDLRELANRLDRERKAEYRAAKSRA